MTGQRDRFQQAMEQGHSAAWDQSWDQAAEYYRQALEESPDHPQALNHLGLAYYELQQYEESLRVYQEAERVSPEDPLPVEKASHLFERLGKPKQASLTAVRAAELYLKDREVNKAIENWSRAALLDANNLPARTRLALVYERLGEKQKAVKEYLALASLLQQAGDAEKARRAVVQALQILPNHEQAQAAMALLKANRPLPKPARPRAGTAPVRIGQGGLPEAEHKKAEQRQDSGADPVSEAGQRALMALAGLLFEGGEEGPDETASRHGMSSIVRGAGKNSKEADSTQILLHLGQAVEHQTNGQPAQAAEELEKAMQAGVDHPAAAFDLGFLQAQTGRSEEALRLLQTAVRSSDFALAARLLMGEILRKEERWQAASVEYLEALKLADVELANPAQGGDEAGMGQLYDVIIDTFQQRADPEAQRRVCDNVREILIRPDWREQMALARKQLPAQEGSEFPMPLAEILTEASSSQVLTHLTRIREIAGSGNLRTAMEEAYFALQFAPAYLPLHTAMGELLLKQDRQQDALDKFSVAARAYRVRSEHDRAIGVYRRMIEIAPMDLAVRSQLIEALMALGRIEEAIQGYLDLGEACYNLADLELARKTYAEALHLAEGSHVDRSWHVQILGRMAELDVQSLDWRQALRIYEQMRTLQPDDEKTRANLVELNYRLGQEKQALAELDRYVGSLLSGGQKDRAIEFIESLLRENPDRVPIRRRLAELYRRVGRSEEAIKHLDILGDSLLEKGDRAGAVQAVEAILALNPPNREDYERLLGQLKGSTTRL